MNWKKLLTTLMLGLTMSVTSEAALPSVVIDKGIFDGGILRVTGIAEVYGDGEKVSTAILQYPKELNPKSVSIDDFSVEGKTIEAVCVNATPEWTKKSVAGVYVILKFKHENSAFDGELKPRGGMKNDNRSEKREGGEAPMRSDRKAPDLKFVVQQTGTVTALDDTPYMPTMKLIESSTVSCPTIDEFKQLEYTSADGVTMPYNVCLPRNYSVERQFPMVVFIPDAGANINEVTTPLFQGNGATIFASSEEQKKHECIVLAPQYTADLVEKLGMMTTDENVWTPGLELVSELIFDATKRFSVDPERIYGTGQSQGGMANIAISDRYPDFFAAQLLVACQWNVEEMAALKDKKLWIVVCEGDTKAFPGMNAAVEKWKSLGVNVAVGETFLNSKAPRAELENQLKTLEAQGADINYTVFAGGNHMYTWSFAYDLDELRDWLFRQSIDKPLGIEPNAED